MREEKDKLDFIVIGAQKAGTTSLFQHLKLHPEIALPRSKEAPFFSHDRGTPTPYTSGWTAYMERLVAESTSDDAGESGAPFRRITWREPSQAGPWPQGAKGL
jgi:hypothetical protein